ncbi:Highly reducing polyketide synthase azaB [Cladobotryum mycophilum]|uniref:Highly reducing polyketide synthase azaB n=1 Tax=Cladobotryum mycophilum TaxID=491253 RepID=A0ABR0S7J4_9HYPO
MAAQDMPIAIIGIGCRFPGSSDSPERLWKLCIEAQSAWSEWPKDRLNEKAFFHPQTEHLGTFHAKGAHFLDEDVSLCDASFFNFSADIARAMDPQVRILLETAFEAFESGMPSFAHSSKPPRLIPSSGTIHGRPGRKPDILLWGALFHDYNDVLMMDVENLPRYAATGNGPTMIANRISHFFDLRGPSISVDTACSTAMASLHLACQSLRSGDAEMAVVGGTNLILHPGSSIGLSTLGFLSASGISYSFDSRASGYGRGEGVGCIIVKPLAAALRDGNPIRAIVRGTAMNQDGHTPTISSPSQDAQERLIRSCYERAGLDPKDTPYVEAHGTGTITGDKTETTTIGNVFGSGRPEGERLIVGSIKSNIGHAESASGISAIAKVIMMFENGCIPPQALFDKPNPQIDFDALNIKIPREAMPWPQNLPRRASVGNFGVGGSNTHAILEDPKYYFSAQSGQQTLSNGHLNVHTNSSSHHLIYTISAKEERSVKAYMDKLQEYLRVPGSQERLRDIAYTLTQRRSHFAWRVAIAASSITSLREALANTAVGPVRASKVPRLGFVFTGQGVLQAADQHLQSLGSSWSVIEELFKSRESTRLHHPFLSFPVTVTLQLALVQLLKSWGITPTAATGHSSGEIAAAYAAGIVNFEEAIAIAYLRGRITSDFIDAGQLQGGMTSLGVGKDEASEYLHGLESKVVIACVNSPSNVTISGDMDALERVEARAQSSNMFFRRLRIPAAYHAPHMQPLAADYATALHAHLEKGLPSKPKVPFSSPVTGSDVSEINELRDPAHWVKNMTQPVLFEDAFVSMVLSGHDDKGKRNSTVDAIIEIGPHDALRGVIRQVLKHPSLVNFDINVDACLKRGTDAVQSMQELAGRLYCQGYPVNFKAINFPSGSDSLKVVHDLPKYQWNHSTRYWAESSVCAETLRRDHAHHDLLGLRIVGLNTKQAIWRNTLRMTDLPWLQHHAVQSEVLFPGVGLAVVAIEAMRQLGSKTDGIPSGYLLSDLDMFKAVVIPTGDQGIEMQVVLGKADKKSRDEHNKSFTFYSRGRNGEWLEHCDGTIVGATARPVALTNISNASDHHSVDVKHFYKCFPKIGPTLGSSFQNVTSLLCDNGSAIGVVTIPDTVAMMPYPYQSECWVHPTILDSCFQVAWAAMPEVILKQMGVCIITYAKTLYLGSATELPVGSTLEVHARITKTDHQGFDFSLSVFDTRSDARHPIFQADGVRVQSLSPRTATSDFDNTMILHPVWQPDVTMMTEKDLGIAIKADQSSIESYKDLQKAAVNVIHDVLADLSPDEEHGVSPHQGKALSWMRSIDSELYATNAIQGRDDKFSFYREIASKSTNGALLSVASKRLTRLFKNEAEPEVMRSNELLRDFYENSLGLGAVREGVQEFARLFAHKNPHLRVLEIGAGFGATTSAVLDGLQRGNSASLTGISYDFTDKVKDFLDSARNRFQSSVKHMRFQTLDIEHDPIAQGFNAEAYDLVVASNVLHATANVQQSIQHARKLLKVGGTLLLVETTKVSPDQCVAFSLGPDWWSNSNSERQWPPLLSNGSWASALKGNGFEVTLNYGYDSIPTENSPYSIIVARTVDDPIEQTLSPPVPSAIIHLPGSVSAPQVWMESLAQNFQNRTGTAISAETFGSPSLSGKPCIIFAEGNQEFLSHVQPEDFEALKITLQEASHVL